jgi:hypothetical protein
VLLDFEDPQAAIASVQPMAASTIDRRLFGTLLALVPCIDVGLLRVDPRLICTCTARPVTRT